ncbi:MAG: type II toxin-antitoxin system VapC family toxin [Armatimonadetes bacterium]|nr:type II toxin-antitoxin system VapC family toxin [Armatimonadota bacterium]
MKCIVDTGAWIALLVEADQYHDIAVVHYEELIERRAHLLTSDFVLDETVTRIRYDATHAAAVAFLDLIRQAETEGSLTVLEVNHDVIKEAEALFRKYEDQVLSFTDCTSVVLAKAARADEVFTFDHHFMMFGFIVVPNT